MYSLRLTCPLDEVDTVSAELWEAGTAGIQEIAGDDATLLIAAFETNTCRNELVRRFARFSPDWQALDTTDWVAHTRKAWPASPVGNRLFLAPPWSQEETPAGRLRVVHNPGLACGTGEHPCTQLALAAMEESLRPGAIMADIGTGSGILSIAALRLGARTAIGIDIDEAALHAARENFELNQLKPLLVAGSADCLLDGCADMVAANMNATVLLSIFDDLLRLIRPGGQLTLTGFTESELPPLQRLLHDAQVSGIADWRCLTSHV